jgi:demethylmenaquinone methyltransferase / 2-methoxy-6-polyprenyl-1,4-benzoquinol methylase
MGEIITNDKDSYQYLVESIEKFLTQDELLAMMEEVGMKECSY